MYDFENICRTCSCEGELQSLFVQDPLIIAEMLTEIVDIKIIKDDEFPQNICTYCLEKLKSAYSFKKQCQDIHMKFEEYCKSFPMNSVPQNFGIEDIVLDKSIKEENLFLVHLENETTDEWSEVNVVPILPKYENENFSPSINEHKIENELIKGKKMFKRRMHECQICSKKTTHLTEHMRSHTKEKPYKCEICGMEFSLRSNCLRHLRIHKNDRPHVCNICGRGFTVRHKLVAHMNIHSKETPFKCELCEESFKRLSQLKLHVSENHCNEKLGFEIITNIDNKKPFLCDHCGKSYSKKIQLEGHIRVHTGERPFVCSVCNKSFYSSLLLSIHRKTHSNEKPYKCNFCDKSFRIRRECRRHELIHTGEKPLKCDICDKSFRQSAHLHRHKRTHTGEKPFSCSLCGRQFIASGNLTVHIRIHHTGETPYLCSICNKGFYDSTSMKKHEKKHLADIK